MAAFVCDALPLDMAKQGLREERDPLLATNLGSARGAGIGPGRTAGRRGAA